MKHYIILTGGISNMGGAEMYTNNKVQYLSSRGWNVQVYFFNKIEKVCLKELAQFTNNYLPELALRICFYSRKQREAIVDKVCSSIGKEDNVYIESQLYGLAIWGELIAEKVKGTHIMNCIQEEGPKYSTRMADYFEFKLKRHEMLNASEKAMKRHFGPFYKKDYLEYAHTARIFCSNVVSEDVEDSLALEQADFNLLSVGRLDKPYVQTMLNEVKVFAEKFKDYKVNFIIIGGSPENKVETEIRNLFKDTSNVHLYLLGYVYPISATLIRKCDVSIASANSILIAHEQGVPTIAVCASDYQGLGIYGETTSSRVSRNGEPVQAINELLECILIKKEFLKKRPSDSFGNEMVKIFDEQIEFLQHVPGDGSYYNVKSIYPFWMYWYNHAKWMLHHYMGQI